MQRCGYATYSGYQVQQNYKVPSCYPGLVYVEGEVFPAPPAKLADVSLEDVKICWDKVIDTGRSRGRRWNTAEISDLERLAAFRPRKKFTHCLAGIGISGARPMVSAKCAYNCAKALFCRVYRLPAMREWGRGPHQGVWSKAREFIHLLLPGFCADRMSVEDWLDTMPARRRKPLAEAAASYARTGWCDHFSKFSSFVKTEFLPGFAKTGECSRLTNMVDRLIQGPHDATHVICGPYLKPLVKKLKTIWPSDGPIFYGSCGPEALHHFAQVALVDAAHQYFWCDFSMFDNTHSLDSWAFLESLYRDAGISDPDFWRTMAAWKQPHGSIGPLKYLARVMNASGRDDTALANGILNGFATYLSACAAWLQVPVLELTLQQVSSCFGVIKLSVCGDDSIGSLPLVSEERMKRFAADMRLNISMFGFEAKLEHSTDISRAVYLGQRLYPVDGKWFWGKTIGRAIYKMGWVLLPGGFHSRDPGAHITGIADMHCLCSSHVPVLCDLAEKIRDLRKGAKRTPVALDPDRPWEWPYSGGCRYDASTISYVAEAYNSTPQEVLDVIHTIRGIDRLPAVVSHPLLDRMIVLDDL